MKKVTVKMALHTSTLGNVVEETKTFQFDNGDTEEEIHVSIEELCEEWLQEVATVSYKIIAQEQMDNDE